jgi:hypothetical protein
MQIEKPQTKPVPKAAKPDTSPPASKVTPKPLNTAAAAPPKNTKTAPAKPGGLSRSFEDSINNIGKAPGAGKAVGTPAAKTATEVRRAIEVSIYNEVLGPWNACKFSGVDIKVLKTIVKFELNRDGTVKKFRSFVTENQNDSNKFQVSRHQECAKLAIERASPFNLPIENYDFWKDYELEFSKK